VATALVRWAAAVALAAMCEIGLAAQAPVQAPPPQAPAYQSNPADEDWSLLKDKSRRSDWWDPAKYIDLGADGWFMTLSGEVRYRPEIFRVRGPGGSADGYLLQRYLFGADTNFGQHVRAFAELQSGIINGKLGTPRPADRNSLDAHQAFVELRAPVGGGRKLSIRVGRQELSIGSTRLISASPGLNVKRSFDGGLVSVQGGTWNVRAAAAGLVNVAPGTFDDHNERDQFFWGMSGNRRLGRTSRTDLGVYYLGIDRPHSLFAQGLDTERRHTLGLQWSAVSGRWDRNYDLVGQWGRFGEASIAAWAVATETGYRFAAGKWGTRLAVRADVASGDKDAAQPSLQTFNPLFPGNAYSGAIGLLGPSNVTDLNVSWMLQPRRGVSVGFEAPSYWRTSTADGVYNTQQQLLMPPRVGTGRYIGTNPGALAVWQITRHLQAQAVVTRFVAGGFASQTFVRHGFGFYSFTGLYRF
jgi:hypothetical protein